jgi:hypothetical protein
MGDAYSTTWYERRKAARGDAATSFSESALGGAGPEARASSSPAPFPHELRSPPAT